MHSTTTTIMNAASHALCVLQLLAPQPEMDITLQTFHTDIVRGEQTAAGSSACYPLPSRIFVSSWM